MSDNGKCVTAADYESDPILCPVMERWGNAVVTAESRVREYVSAANPPAANERSTEIVIAQLKTLADELSSSLSGHEHHQLFRRNADSHIARLRAIVDEPRLTPDEERIFGDWNRVLDTVAERVFHNVTDPVCVAARKATIESIIAHANEIAAGLKAKLSDEKRRAVLDASATQITESLRAGMATIAVWTVTELVQNVRDGTTLLEKDLRNWPAAYKRAQTRRDSVDSVTNELVEIADAVLADYPASPKREQLRPHVEALRTGVIRWGSIHKSPPTNGAGWAAYDTDCRQARIAIDAAIYEIMRIENSTPTADPAGEQPVQRRARGLSRDEANSKVREYLEVHPDATVREIAKAIGCAVGRVSELPVWISRQAERQTEAGPKHKAPKAVRLSKVVLDNTIAPDSQQDELDRLIDEQRDDHEPSPLESIKPGKRLRSPKSYPTV